jgi:hypothetical protein
MNRVFADSKASGRSGEAKWSAWKRLHDPRSRFSGAVAFLLGGVLLASTPLAAQETAAATQTVADAAAENEIVVEGRRNRDELINAYERGLNTASSNDPLARYAPEDYCPAVLGLSPASNKQIATRMRKVATAAGVKPAEEDCVSSALVIFTYDKAAFLQKFQSRHPKYFNQLQGGGRHLAKVDGPAVAWHLVQVQGTKSPEPGGLFFSAVTPVIAMSVVVVDRSALLGLTPTQIADYVLMRTLTDREPGALDVPNDVTILKALHAPMNSAVPASLTRWDLAYLKGRYTGHPGRYSTRQAAAIRGMMRRALSEAASN